MAYDHEFDEGAWAEDAARVQKELAERKKNREREENDRFFAEVGRSIEKFQALRSYKKNPDEAHAVSMTLAASAVVRTDVIFPYLRAGLTLIEAEPFIAAGISLSELARAVETNKYSEYFAGWEKPEKTLVVSKIKDYLTTALGAKEI